MQINFQPDSALKEENFMHKFSSKQVVLIAVLSALFSGIVVACAQRMLEHREAKLEPVAIADPSVASDEQNNIEIYRAVSPGVVYITTRVYQEGIFGIFPAEGSGSGSVIDDRGHILTNYHVIQGAQQVEVQIGEDKYPARVVGTDRDNDLAVIKVDAPRERLVPVKLGTSSNLQVGQKVLAIGNPFGLQRTLTTGIISGLERPIRDPVARRTIQGAIQTDASINPGNSGGPLLNARGEMIGINTMIYSPSGGSVGIGFAVPVDTAKKIIPDLISRGYVPRPWLGISLLPLTRDIVRAFGLPVDSGLIIGEVYRGSGAAAAGLRGSVVRETLFGVVLQQIGDIILAIDGKPVASAGELQQALQEKKPGQVVQLEILRSGRRMTVPVRLGERPPE
jgi:S1-C subfamily serine protease